MGKNKARPRKQPAAVRQKPGSTPKKQAWRRPLVWLGATGSAVLIGVLVSVLSNQAQRVVPSPPSAPSGTEAPHLEIDQVSLAYARVGESDLQRFQIDIKLLNTGPQIAAINSASLVIQDAIKLPQCAGQGGFVSTGSYTANLPADPSSGQVVSIPVSQLVNANGADRFDLLLSPPQTFSDTTGRIIYLYRIHLYLRYNAHNTPLDAGEIVVSSETPAPGEYFLSKYWAAHQTEFDSMAGPRPGAALALRNCDIRGSRVLYSFLTQPGMRVTDVAAIPSQLAF